MSKVHRLLASALCSCIRLFAGSAIVAVIGLSFGATRCVAQSCVQLLGQAYSQNFNSLPASGASHNSSTLPIGFSFVETGSGADATYAADNGGAATPNTYSYGEGTDTDRALGEITSLAVRSFCGVCFLNNTGFTIPSLSVSFAGEQWRLGTADALIDRLDFQYSKTANSPGDNAAAWTNVDALDFYTPTNTGVGAKDGNDSDNRQVFSPTTILPAGGLPVGGRLYLRWVPLDVGNSDDGLAIDDFQLTYTPSADFNLDSMVNGADLLALQRGYGTTSGATVAMGDANKDGAVNASDVNIWQSQFGAFGPGGGSAVGASAVPEPSGVVLAGLAAMCLAAFVRGGRRRRAALVAAAWLGAWGGVAPAQNVSLSLNVFPTSNANPNGGGAWTLVAKTNSANGIAGIDAFLTGINVAGVTYGSGINAATDGGAPFVVAGTPNELVYFQDFGLPGIVVGVGTPAFSSALDPFGSATWNNSTRIASGTYSGAVPAFAANSGTRVNAANVLSTSTPPFTHADDATITMLVTRVGLTGDYDLNGAVNASDYVVWRNNLGSSTSLRNDPTVGVGADDYTRWRANFGTAAGSGTSVSMAAVPEPSSWLLMTVSCSFWAQCYRARRRG